MTWTFRPHANTIQGRGGSGCTAADRPVCPLVFSAIGWLTQGLVLVMQEEASLALLSLALILGAAPVAAMLALRCAGDADELVP
jgi:hypothetical protein